MTSSTITSKSPSACFIYTTAKIVLMRKYAQEKQDDVFWHDPTTLDRETILAHSIDLQYFIMMKNKKRLPRSQKEILKKRMFTKILL
jgi:hypothetical protein